MVRALAFPLGVAAIAFGVCVHLVMFFGMGEMQYQLAGMPLDGWMIAGMVAIVGGLALAGFALVPSAAQRRASARAERAAPASRAHALLLLAITFAMIIDVMKPATLSFVVPGMIREYHVTKSAVALLPLVALSGTVIGSVMWGILGDLIGRRGSILFAALMFMGTAICGTMPSFEWNLAMCFLMGTSAGGMIPVAFAIVSETLPANRRRFSMVLLGGFGSVGGYVAASGLAYALEPHFGWRVLWLAGLPTGLMLVALSRFIPESPAFGRASAPPAGAAATAPQPGVSSVALWLNACALAWSTINFGFIFWLPTNFRELGWSASLTDGLLVKSALFSFASTPLVAWAHQRWPPRATILGLAALQSALLLAFAAFARDPAAFHPAVLVVLLAGLLIAANGFICVLLPFAAELFPSQVRARGTGFVAGSSKLGGLLPLLVAKLGFVPTLAVSGAFSGAVMLVSAAGLTGALLRRAILTDSSASARGGRSRAGSLPWFSIRKRRSAQ